MRKEVILGNAVVGLKRRGKFNKKRWGPEVGLVEIHHKEKDLTFAQIERKLPVLRSAFQGNP